MYLSDKIMVYLLSCHVSKVCVILCSICDVTEFSLAVTSEAYSPDKRRKGRVSCAVARNREYISRLSGCPR